MSGRAAQRWIADAADALLEASVIGSFTRVGYDVRRHLDGWDALDPAAMVGRTALVTGASSGLGLTTASALASLGAKVILLGRNPDRLDAAVERIREVRPAAQLDVVVADLASLAAVDAAAGDLCRRHDHLDVVVHNAGTMVHDLEVTSDELEVTVQTHVVAPFLLTSRLLGLLAASSDPRVIQVVSGGLYTTQLSVRELTALPVGSPDQFDGVRAYARAKRGALSLVASWAQRTAASPWRSIRFHAMHPGWADTPGVEAALPGFRRAMGPLLRHPEQAVDTTVWLAAAEEARRSNGQLWLDRRRRRTSYLPGTADPPGEADRLWAWATSAAHLADPLAPFPLAPFPGGERRRSRGDAAGRTAR